MSQVSKEVGYHLQSAKPLTLSNFVHNALYKIIRPDPTTVNLMSKFGP